MYVTVTSPSRGGGGGYVRTDDLLLATLLPLGLYLNILAALSKPLRLGEGLKFLILVRIFKIVVLFFLSPQIPPPPRTVYGSLREWNINSQNRYHNSHQLRSGANRIRSSYRFTSRKPCYTFHGTLFL